jgi:hypothetical protein
MFQKYEAAIYNQEVRELLSDGQHHEVFEDIWADLQFIEVSATNRDQAMRRLNNRYPESRGFVITRVFGPEDER